MVTFRKPLKLLDLSLREIYVKVCNTGDKEKEKCRCQHQGFDKHGYWVELVMEECSQHQSSSTALLTTALSLSDAKRSTKSVPSTKASARPRPVDLGLTGVLLRISPDHRYPTWVQNHQIPGLKTTHSVSSNTRLSSGANSRQKPPRVTGTEHL
ncbi:nuclear RNA polymerase D2A [Striga asiatica]|uniref:Nuclear RNA polymerase D2A n=1 Tax=Striga asiatica TaxID=4170 RepID=A0A5A7R161_STRAF|nr:nuclear RNA polymerase D2A [Striga asiatica]